MTQKRQKKGPLICHQEGLQKFAIISPHPYYVVMSVLNIQEKFSLTNFSKEQEVMDKYKDHGTHIYYS